MGNLDTEKLAKKNDLPKPEHLASTLLSTKASILAFSGLCQARLLFIGKYGKKEETRESRRYASFAALERGG